MPQLPPHLCQHPGCGRLIYGTAAKCPKHGGRSTAEIRRFRNSPEWAAIRAAILRRDPICRWIGCKEPSTSVDHRNGNTRDNRPSNLMGLCQRHHGSKTVADREFEGEDVRWLRRRTKPRPDP